MIPRKIQGGGEALDAPSISARFEKLELLVTALKTDTFEARRCPS